MRRAPSRRTPFTLLELLVVIAILSLLAGMLIASVGRAKERARRGVCVNNMTQIGLALHMYGGDNDDYLPGLLQGGMGALAPPYANYMPEESEIWACPSTDNPGYTEAFSNYLYAYPRRLNQPNADDTKMAFEDPQNHQYSWFHILFLDGHVEGFVP